MAKNQMDRSTQSPSRRTRGFEPAGDLLKSQIRAASEKRGFAVARLLTHWTEVAGDATARITRPVKVGYGREGMGATLTLLVAGAHAPQVQMGLEALRERVNAVYGYNAIARITLTQTAATGFAEGQAEFTPAPKNIQPPDPVALARAAVLADAVGDTGLRAALEIMGQNILARKDKGKGFGQ